MGARPPRASARSGVEASHQAAVRLIRRDVPVPSLHGWRTGHPERNAGVALAIRLTVYSTLAGRDFEPLQVDVTIAAPQPWDAQSATREGLPAALGLPPVHVLLIPLEGQVAEKLHATTRLYKSGGTARARDVIDLLLIQRHARVDGTRLGKEIQSTFERRATHAVPAALPQPPAALAVGFRRDAPAVGLSPSLDEAHRLRPVRTAHAAPQRRSSIGDCRHCRRRTHRRRSRRPTAPRRCRGVPT